MRSYAVIPPLILDARQKRCVFYNENGLVTDMENDFKVCLNILRCVAIRYWHNATALPGGGINDLRVY